MSKPTPEQQAAFDAKLAGYKFDTSEYVVDPNPRPCCIERQALQARVAELVGVLSLCGAHFNSGWHGETGDKNKRMSERGCRRKIAKTLKGGA